MRNMRRDNRARNNNKDAMQNKIIMYSIIGVAFLTIVLVGLLMYSSSLNKEMQDNAIDFGEMANITSNNNAENTTNTNTQSVSSKKIGWGIKRNNNHEQPDVGKQNQKILEENNGICLGNSEEKTIYLTFDEGYEAGYTEKILSILKENDVKAAFFITAHYVNTQEELVKQMIEDGHIVGNHTPISLMSGNNINVKC